uniref:non-specific serine/threonine protein kinase n=1 Tax=Caenorhabditis tropicalis TaxID=1561998 RepID=A0A1I7TGM2_9PELO
MTDFSPKNIKTLWKISDGGHAVVTLVETVDSPKQRFAAKTMSFERGLKKVRNEYEIHEELFQKGHKNIIGMYARRSNLFTHTLYLEYAEGGDLFRRLEAPLMSRKDAKRFFRHLISGMKFIHQNGIVHRDIKPENLLLKNGLLKITDFGSALRYINEKGEEIWIDSPGGTRQYRAPEMIACEKYRGPPVDIWSCGVTFMVMLTGMQSWDEAGESSNSYGRWVSDEEYEKNPWNTVEVEGMALLRQMLTDDPESRAKAEEIETNPWILEESDKENKTDEVEDDNA